MSCQPVDVLDLIARGAPLEPTLNRIVLLAEDRYPDAVGAIMLLEQDGSLRLGAGPRLPLGFVSGIDDLAIGPDQASCGTAVFRRQPVFASSIEDEAAWGQHRELALTHGFQACWSAPITISSDRIVGTLALYFREPRRPTDVEREFASDARLLAAIAVEKHLNEEAIQTHASNLQRSLKTIQTALDRIRLIVGDNWPVERERTVIATETLHVARLIDDLREGPYSCGSEQQKPATIEGGAEV
jgi:GAF domain-containing protein